MYGWNNMSQRLSAAAVRASLGLAVYRQAVVIICVGLWTCSCSSLYVPYSASFAAAKISGVSAEAIRSEMAKVFSVAEYQATPTAEGFVFEREGERRDQIAYGSVIDAQPVRIRVKVQIVPLGGEVHRLQCIAYAVRGQRVEEEIRLPYYRSGPYQDLLEKVVSTLKPVTVIRR